MIAAIMAVDFVFSTTDEPYFNEVLNKYIISSSDQSTKSIDQMFTFDDIL